jgi:uncharacterized membrane protein YhaH (DUF805 family)
MGFGQAVRTCLGKYGTFSGRASRSEFWWFYLFTTIVSGIPILLGGIFLGVSSGSSADGSAGGISLLIAVLLYIVGVLASLAFLVPSIAVGCRRLHDRGTSGWLQLLLMVPCANIVLLVFWILAGTEGDNVYGPKPTNA